MGKVLIFEMTREEAEEAFRKTDLAIIPIGATEQHGPHLPMGTDAIIAQEMAKRVGERTGAVVTPCIPFGYSKYHMPFRGTITIRPQLIIELLKEIGKSLAAHGIKKIVILNGHMGNANTLGAAAAVIQDEIGVRVAVCDYIYVTDEVSKEITGRDLPSITVDPIKAYDGWEGHAAGKETDGVLAVRPDLVHLDKAVNSSPAKQVVERTRSKGFYTLMDDVRKIAPTAWWGSVEGVSKEEAERFYNMTADRIVDRIKKIFG